MRLLCGIFEIHISIASASKTISSVGISTPSQSPRRSGLLGGGNARSLLDATPLWHFLNTHLHCERIQDNIKRGYIYALTISATNYNSGKSYLFIQGAKGHPMWNRSRRVTLATRITVDHICASAAIPLVFPPVILKTARGTAFFGDGCLVF